MMKDRGKGGEGVRVINHRSRISEGMTDEEGGGVNEGDYAVLCI